MAEQTSRTMHDDAPLSKAKDPNATSLPAASVTTRPSDSIASETVTVNRPRQQLYEFWRKLENLPSFMDNVERIDVLDNQRSHWVVLGPAGRRVEWDSIIIDDRPGDRIAWTVDVDGDSSVQHSGSVTFKDATGKRGTTVTATIIYDPPGGAIGKAIAKLFQREPAIQVRRELRRFKQLMETGEIATAEPPDAAPRA